jgi:outer membrane protein TolC
MLALIKLIHTLNRQIDTPILNRSRFPSAKLQPSDGNWQPILTSQTKMRLQVICAIVALSLGGLSMETTQAKTLDFAGIRQSLQISPTKESPLNRASVDRHRQNYIAQTKTTTPAPSDRIKLENNLNLPKTGGEVQITNNKSLTLQEAIEIAFRNNRDLQVARLNIERDRAGVRAAQAAKSVQVGLTSTLQNQGAPLITVNQNQQSTSDTTIQGRLQATYPIIDAGLNSGSIRAAEEQVKFNKLDLIRVEQQVRGNVITAYYDLQQADSSVIINQAAVKDAARSLSDAQLQEKAGVGTKFDILRAEVQLATSNQNLVNAQGQQQTARKKIAQILFVDNNTEFTAADTVRESGTWDYSLEDSVVLAYKNRPEVQQQLALRNASAQQQIVAAASDSAQVNLFSNYTLGQSIGGSAPAQDSYSIGAQLSWSFWDGGAAGARSGREKINQEIFENQFATQRNQIRFEVEQAYYSLGTSKKNIATSTQALKQAEESLKLARLRFQAGVGTQTDVIQAQTDLATARGNRITAIINYNRALSSLRIATVTVQK